MQNVTIQDLGSFGELVAALATVATLIYLAVQIRQNTQTTQAASFHAIYDSMNHVNVAVIQNSELTRIWLAGSEDRSTLNPEERHKFDFTLLSYFHVFETLHFQGRIGVGEFGFTDREQCGHYVGHMVLEPCGSLAESCVTEGAQVDGPIETTAFAEDLDEKIDLRGQHLGDSDAVPPLGIERFVGRDRRFFAVALVERVEQCIFVRKYSHAEIV